VGLELHHCIATLRAVPWREHADEAVESLPIIQNAERFSFRRARATHDPYHVTSRLDVPIFQVINKIQLKACLFNPLNEAESTWVRSYPVLASTWTRSAMVLRPKNERLIMLKQKIILVVLLSLITGTLMAQEAKVTSLMSKDLKDFPGKEGLLITVEYPPGATDPIHRHNAHAFVYVLEGSIVMQLKGGKEVTLTPGQTFYEGPDDVHIVGRSADKTKPARFIVFLVKDKGAPVLVPVK
jgi:quercetin dioxygenase-like cupin family protein